MSPALSLAGDLAAIQSSADRLPQVLAGLCLLLVVLCVLAALRSREP